MSRAFLCLCGLLVSSWCWSGASPAAWALDGPGGRITLLGSVHLGRPDFYPLSAPIEQAFAQASVLAVELDISAVDGQQLSQQLARIGYFPEGQGDLWSALSEPQGRQLTEFCADYSCPPAAQLTRMRPWLLSFILGNQMMQAAGYSAELGVDRHFLQRRADRQLVALESLTGQLNLFAQLPVRDQGRLLMQTLSDYAQGPEYLEALMDAWYQGDRATLEALVVEPFLTPDNAVLYDRLLVQRNRAMADQLVARAAEGGRLFVVVGAGHLAGPEGLVALLEARGFTAKPL